MWKIASTAGRRASASGYRFDYDEVMPVYMITLHAYRSWTEDNPKGYYQHGEHGVQSPNNAISLHRARTAQDPPRRFTTEQKQFIVDQIPDIVTRRGIRLHAASCTASHVHLVTSWFGKEAFFSETTEQMAQAKHLAVKVKNIVATLLSKQDGSTGNRWFSRGCDCTPVVNHEHLNHLLEIYLLKHRYEGGIVRIFDNGHTTP